MTSNTKVLSGLSLNVPLERIVSSANSFVQIFGYTYMQQVNTLVSNLNTNCISGLATVKIIVSDNSEDNWYNLVC